MRRAHFLVWMCSIGMAALLSAGLVCAQNYHNKPIRITTTEPGGGGDFTARLIAQGISAPMGQQVIVDNRSGSVPWEIVAKAPPDGYTLMVAGSAFWLAPLLQKVPYDVEKDFAAITWVSKSPNLLVVTPSVPARSVSELIALAKAKPGELNYATTATGNQPHIAGELFKSMAGVDIVRINYRGTAPAINELISGQVQLLFAVAPTVAQHVKSGRLRALAVTSLEPSPLAPGLPTVAASGLAGYESLSLLGVFAPAHTPAPIINRLNREVVRILLTPELKEKFFNTGVEVVASAVEEFAAKVKSERVKWGKVIKDAGIRIE